MGTEDDRLLCLDEQWKIIFNEQIRSPIYAVGHYISYLRKYVHGEEVSKGRYDPAFNNKEGISPMSYLLRKLKLDLKMSYDSFLYEFVSPNHDGLSLLFGLLKKLQNSTSGKQKSATLSSKHSSVEEYKRVLTDEHDCLLSIKFTLRLKVAQEQLLENFSNLETLVWSLLSSNVKSRITALEILTLSLAVPGGFDKVFDTFTYMRLKLGESVKFKLLISMLNSRGSIIFQVACMRFLNTLCNCPSSGGLRVYLQEELRMAGLDIAAMAENCTGDGLEYDDLRKEIDDWHSRYINVDTLLRKCRVDFRSSRERRYDRMEGQVNYAVVQGQPQVNPRQDTRSEQLSSKSVPNLHALNGGPRVNDVTITYTSNGVVQRVDSWAEARYNLSQIGHKLTSLDQEKGDDYKIFQGVPNMSYPFPDIRHYIMTYDTTCLTGDTPDVLLRVLHMTHHRSDLTPPGHRRTSHTDGLHQLSQKLHTIQECEDRLKLIGFMNHYSVRLMELRTKSHQINRACESMLYNPKMKQLFEIILEFGTRMNGLKHRESQRGFKLSSLESLSKSHVSSNDHTQTVLDYLVSEVRSHYPQVHGWYHELDADIPSSVSLRVMEKQMDYLKNGVKILQMESVQYPDIKTLKAFLKGASDMHVQVEGEYTKMAARYKEVCGMLGESNEVEPRDLFDMVTRFAADYRLTVEKMERLNSESVSKRPSSGGSVSRVKARATRDFDDVTKDSTLTRTSNGEKSSVSNGNVRASVDYDDITADRTLTRVDAQIESASKRRHSGLNCFQDTSTDNNNVPPAIARRKRLSKNKNKSVPNKSSSPRSWFSFGRKSKSLSQPNLHREPLDPGHFEQQLNKDGSTSKTSLDGNWMLHSPPAESKDLRQTSWKSEPQLSGSPGHYLPDFLKEGSKTSKSNADVSRPLVFSVPTVDDLSQVADVKETGDDAEDLPESPKPDYSVISIPTPSSTVRSYNAELAEILNDFEKTLHAHGDDTPRYMDGESSRNMGPVVFV